MKTGSKDKLFKNMLDNPVACAYRVSEFAMELFGLRRLGSSFDNDELESYLRLAKNMLVAHFQFAIDEGENVKFDLDGVTHTATGVNKGYALSISHWLSAYSLCLIFRDSKSLNKLCEFGHAQYVKSELKWTNFDISILEMFKGLLDERTDLKELVLTVMKESDPEGIPHEEHDYVYSILLPLANVYTLIFSKDQKKKYTNSFVDAVKSHKKYWLTDEHDVWGHHSMFLTAAACLAYDRKGYTLPVKTEYIPEWLVENT